MAFIKALGSDSPPCREMYTSVENLERETLKKVYMTIYLFLGDIRQVRDFSPK
jgi:hypothetical protein